MCFIIVPPSQKRIDVKIKSYPDESDKGRFPCRTMRRSKTGRSKSGGPACPSLALGLGRRLFLLYVSQQHLLNTDYRVEFLGQVPGIFHPGHDSVDSDGAPFNFENRTFEARL